jgi:hypothetical protein
MKSFWTLFASYVTAIKSPTLKPNFIVRFNSRSFKVNNEDKDDEMKFQLVWLGGA